MMEGRLPHRGEYKLTVLCTMCGHRFGGWRERCDACGTPRPEEKPPKVVDIKEARKKKRERKPRPEHPTRCVFCRRRGAKRNTCPKCKKPVHSNCRALHVERCEGEKVTS